MPFIETLENLKHLDLTQNFLGRVGCWKLAQAMKNKHITLDYLNLDSNQIPNSGFYYLLNGIPMQPKLKHLIMSNNLLDEKIGWRLINWYEKELVVFHLDLSGNNFGGLGYEQLMSFIAYGLKVPPWELILKNTKPSVEVLRILRDGFMIPPYHDDLDLLDLSDNQLSESQIGMLKAFESKSLLVKY